MKRALARNALKVWQGRPEEATRSCGLEYARLTDEEIKDSRPLLSRYLAIVILGLGWGEMSVTVKLYTALTKRNAI